MLSGLAPAIVLGAMVGMIQTSHEQRFRQTASAFVAAAEKYADAVGRKPIADVEAAGKQALALWSAIPSPSQEFPNTQAIRRIRTPVNALAKIIGGQVFDIASDGHIGAEAFAKRLVTAAVQAAKRSLDSTNQE